MNIVMFSMTPLYEEKSMGGAQKQLKKVALHLAQQGHEVTLLCTRRHADSQPFRWHANAQIIPLYRFKQPFPEPYATPVYNIAHAVQETGEYLAQADVFYSHDGGLIFPYVSRDIPTVISLRSVLFSETLQSGFLFQGDALILPSEHTAQVWTHTAGRFFADYHERIHVIHNGLDFDAYRPRPVSEDLLSRLPIDPADHRVLLYPHRPEAAKGIWQVIKLVDALVHEYSMDDVIVLMPQWIDEGLSVEDKAFYRDLRADISARGLDEHFAYHEWISDALMPEYYNIGDLTVALGNYVETFGNVPYESLACGTPVIAARVGPYRQMLPPEHITLVDYDDNDAAAAQSAQILRERKGVSDAVMTWLHANFQQRDMVQGYADVILNAQKQAPMPYQHMPLAQVEAFRLAPWCYLAEERIYHDFAGHYYDVPELVTLLQTHETLSAEVAPLEQLRGWVAEGLLVPLQAQT